MPAGAGPRGTLSLPALVMSCAPQHGLDPRLPGIPTAMVASTTAQQLRQCLNDVDFPTNKQDLLDAADRNGCDEETRRALRAIPPETFTNVSQVTASVTIADDDAIHDGDKAAARRSHTKPGRAETAKDIATESPIVDELGKNRGS